MADGFIVQINAERGLLVAFYGNARGWLPKTELEKFGYAVNQKLSEIFYLGQVIRVRIRQVDPANERMLLSPSESATATAADGNEKENAETAPARHIKKEPGASSLKKGGALAIGKIYTAVITKVQKTQLDVLIENRHQGRVFVTELSDSFDNGSAPLGAYCVGQAVLVKVINIRTKRHGVRKRKDSRGSETEILGADEAEAKKTFHFAECTTKKSKIAAKSAKKRVIGYKDEFRKGEKVPVVIEEFTSKDGVLQGCRVAANPNWKGDISVLHLSTSIDVLRHPRDHLMPGQVINARVTGLQAAEKHLQLSCLPAKANAVSMGVQTRALVIKEDVKDEMAIKCRLPDGSYGYVPKEELGGSSEAGQILEVRPLEKLAGGKWRLSTKSAFIVGKKIKEEPTFEAIVSKKPADETGDIKPVIQAKEAASEAAKKMKQAAGFSWDSGRFSMANLMNLCLDKPEADGEMAEKTKSKKMKKDAKTKFERERLEEDELLQVRE